MMSSAESQNQLQHCLVRLSEVAKTPEERVATIRMAWNGYRVEKEKEPESSSGVGWFFIVLGVGGFYLHWALGSFLVFIGLMVLLGQPGETHTAPIDYGRLQDLGNEVLKAGYAIWKDSGIKLFESAMVEAAGAVQIASKQIVFWPEQSISNKDPESIKPTFSEVQRILMMGYIATASSLMVFPATGASIKNISFWQSFTESFAKSESIVLELFLTSIGFASKGNRDEKVIISGLGKLSFIELYFSDMITVEYSASKRELGQLKLTTRDGRNFVLCANQEVSELVREGIRASKGIAQGSSPTPSIIPA